MLTQDRDSFHCSLVSRKTESLSVTPETSPTGERLAPDDTVRSAGPGGHPGQGPAQRSVGPQLLQGGLPPLQEADSVGPMPQNPPAAGRQTCGPGRRRCLCCSRHGAMGSRCCCSATRRLLAVRVVEGKGAWDDSKRGPVGETQSLRY